MRKLKTRIEGLDALLGELARVPVRGTDAMHATVREVAENIRDIAKASMISGAGPAPPGSPPHRQTGELAESVDADVRVSGEKIKATIGTDAVEGYFLEIGRANAEARPWLFPAFERATLEARGVLKQKFEAER